MDVEGFRSKLLKYLPNFYNDEKYSDFEFLLNGGVKRKGHKFILVLRCDGLNIEDLETMSLLDLSGFRRSTSEVFIRWIYTGIIPYIDKTVWKELSDISVSLNLTSLYERCKIGMENDAIVEINETLEHFEEDSWNAPEDLEDTAESESNLPQDTLPETCIVKSKRKSPRPITGVKQIKPKSAAARMQHCQPCGKNFTSKLSLKKHLKSTEHKQKVVNSASYKTEGDVHKCDVCDKLLNSDSDLEQHLILVHKLDRINGKKCPSEEAVADDPKSIQTEEPYNCEVCSESFTSNNDHELHLKIHKIVSKLSCEFCQEQFFCKEELKKHKAANSHNIVKVLKCDVCSKSFKTAQNLQRHLLLHTGVKPYLCSECGQSFIQLTQLEVHLRGHTGERPYHCGHCPKTFASKFIYKQHLEIHSARQKQYICDVCGKSFNRQSSCRRHVQLHADSKPFKCEDCGKGYSTKHALQGHTHRIPTKSCRTSGVTHPSLVPVSMATVSVLPSNNPQIIPSFFSNTFIHVQNLPEK